MYEPPRIAIFCMSTTHPTKPSIAGIFERGHRGEWKPRLDIDIVKSDLLPNVPERGVLIDEILTDRMPEPEARRPLGPDGPLPLRLGVRRSYNLKCPRPLCPITVPARGERLDAALDQLWRDFPEVLHQPEPIPVPLGLLAARLRSSKT